MRGYVVLAVVVSASCGRVDFDAVSDAGAIATDSDAAYTGFSIGNFATCPDGLALLDMARCIGGDLELTADVGAQVGEVWSTTPITLGASSHLEIELRLRFSAVGVPGDGMTVVLSGSPAGPSARGAGSSYLGYGDIAPSEAVELDAFDNGPPDIAANHVGIDRDGSFMTLTAVAAPLNMSSGAPFTVWVDYDGPTAHLDASISATTTKPIAPLVGWDADLSSLGPDVWIGLTASTGGNSEAHHVLSWRVAYQR